MYAMDGWVLFDVHVRMKGSRVGSAYQCSNECSIGKEIGILYTGHDDDDNDDDDLE